MEFSYPSSSVAENLKTLERTGEDTAKIWRDAGSREKCSRGKHAEARIVAAVFIERWVLLGEESFCV